MKNNNILDNITWNFIKLEERNTMDGVSHISTLKSLINDISDKLRSQDAKNKIPAINLHLNGLMNYIKNLNQEISDLKEKIETLENKKSTEEE